MNTKLILTASALFLGSAGLALTFIPAEILGYFKIEATKLLQLFLQIGGALYFSFALLNWMSKANIIGGIYNRPIAVANFTHFFIAGLALIKALISNPDLMYGIWAIGILYTAFAISFGVILFTHPLSEPPKN